jgi:hypothetical protein
MFDDKLISMVGNRWEIGICIMTHIHLLANQDLINFKTGQSKDRMASEIRVYEKTCAYPYGEIGDFVVDKAADYEYLTEDGLGTQYIHSLKTSLFLCRIEVRNNN